MHTQRGEAVARRFGVVRLVAAATCLGLLEPPISPAGCAPGPLDAIGLASGTLSEGLLAHYTFDEGAGTTVADHSGNKRDGVLTLTGGAWIPDGQFAGGLRLSGADFVTVNNFPDATPSFSVSAWIRSADMPVDGFETIVSTELVFQGGWQLNLDKAAAAMGVHAAFWDTTLGVYTYYECPCLPVNRWTHLASVVDGNAHTLSVYVDGQLESVTPAPNPISPGSPVLYIGRWSGQNRFLVADIDDITIYGRALASAEIVELGLYSPG